VRTLARGAILGAGFGLAVTGVDAWIGVAQIMQFNMAPPLTLLVKGAALGVGLGAALGTAGAGLLLLAHGRLWHLLAVALAWAALAIYAAPDSRSFQLFMLVSPGAGILLALLGGWVARRWRALPVILGVAAVAAAIVTPEVRARLHAVPAPAPRMLPRAAAGVPDVVLVVLDTVRADHVSAYGYARPTTPTFDALAHDAALFLDAVAPATWSLPSHASLFTGRFASAHGAHDEHRFLDPGPPTLAETLAAAGYDTRSFTANAWISDALGLTRGFAWTDEAWRAGTVGRTFQPMYRLLDRLGLGAIDKGGSDAVANFERWLAARPPDAPPAFTFLNFIEAHFPYHQLPADYLARFSERSRGELRALSLRLMAAQFSGEAIDPVAAAPVATAMYDAGILYADMLLGRVVEALRRRGSLDRTILAVLADHGEMLGEHGEFGHGLSLYEPALHVPLLVRYPPRVTTARVARPVSTVGVYATVLDLAGITPPPSLQVGSLVPAIAGRAAGEPVLAEQFASMLGGSVSKNGSRDPLLRQDIRFRAFRVGRRKLVETSAGTFHLFDLDADPTEARDLAPAEPDAVARLRGELETWRAALGLAPLDAPVGGGPAPEIDPAARERLRALGYVQ
jgi:arylsulfatase A-like enzyme